MTNNFTLKVDEELRNKVEAAFYETETAARNASIALSRNDQNDKFNSSFAFQWERLVKYAKVYEDLKEVISDTIVRPELDKRGIANNVGWNLDFETSTLTVTYDDEETEAAEKTNTVVIDCPKELVDPVEAVSVDLNAYDTIYGYISRSQGAGIDAVTLNKLSEKQSETYKAFVKARNEVESKVVQPYLAEKNIEVNVSWELKYSSRKITITY
jgi:hypothetical protein